MTTPTLHKGFNKILEKECILSGNVFSSIQNSMYVRGIDNVECNGFNFKKGELYQKDINSFTSSMKHSYRSGESIRNSFLNKVFDLCSEGDTCLYIFRNSPKSAAIALAVSNKSGLQHFVALKEDEKTLSIINFIKKELNQKGWF